MNKQKLEQFRQNLLKEQESLHTRIKKMDDDGLGIPLQESVSELSSYDNHPADLGSEVFERSKDFALREGMEIQLAQVERALQDIQEGDYGICAECGREIPLERLEALPSANKCITCKEQEDLPDRHLRPIEEDVIVPPFGGFTHDNSEHDLGDSEDDNMFDGEDAWQILAHFGEHAEESDAGSYYAGMDFDEDIGAVDDIDQIPYERGADGMIYSKIPISMEPDDLFIED